MKSILNIALLCLLVGLLVFSFSCGDDDDDDNDDDDDATDDDDSTDDDDTTDDDDDTIDDDVTGDDDTSDDDTSDDDTSDDDTTDDDDDTAEPGFVFISNGTFMMGSQPGEPGGGGELHEVTLTNDFVMSIFETTQAEFTEVIGINPSHFGPNGPGEECGDNCPVENLNWYNTLAYANELSLNAGYDPCYTLSEVICVNSYEAGDDYMACMNWERRGIDRCEVAVNAETVYQCEGYRLPTEAEWEYAIRAGTTTAFYSGDITDLYHDPNLDMIGWYIGNNSTGTKEVGLKMPNDWGLYDMSGNVEEWVWDLYGYAGGTVSDPTGPTLGYERVHRGGGFRSSVIQCKSAYRRDSPPIEDSYTRGFRVVRTVQ